MTTPRYAPKAPKASSEDGRKSKEFPVFYSYACCLLQEPATCHLQMEITVHRSIEGERQIGDWTVAVPCRVCNNKGTCAYQSDPLDIEFTDTKEVH